MSISIPAGTAAATAGICGMLHAPEASTTVALAHSPWSVVTTYPASVRRTEVTVVSVWTGAETTLA